MPGDDSLQKIEDVLEQLRPNIQMDGGDIELVKFENGIVYIRFQGACVHCPISSMTLKMGIEESLKNAIPDVVEVIAVND